MKKIVKIHSCYIVKITVKPSRKYKKDLNYYPAFTNEIVFKNVKSQE